MEGAHEQIHRGHSAQRRRLMHRRAGHIRAASENSEQRLDAEGRRSRQTELVGRANGRLVAGSGTPDRGFWFGRTSWHPRFKQLLACSDQVYRHFSCLPAGSFE